MTTLLRNTAIVGIGQTEFSKFSGRSELQLAVEASRAALEDAGMEPSDIEGMVTFKLDPNDELEVMHNLGVPELKWVARTPGGGGGASATVQLASAAVVSGMAKAVLIYRAFNERSGKRFGQPFGAPQQRDIHVSFGLDTPAKIYAMWYQPYMETYGVTNEDLADYVVVARANAATNPRAWFYEKPITKDDHQNSRWIVEPVLRLLDCCQESDGGVALIVTSADRAKDLKNGGVRVLAATQSHVHGTHEMFNYYRPDMTEFQEVRAISDQLWNQSGLGPKEIDGALLYENFSPGVHMALEAHGFCGKGEAKDFIRDGNIALTGRLPVNTHGGLLGEGYIHGVNNLLEAVRQIRGTAANQVKGAEVVLASAGRSAAILGPL